MNTANKTNNKSVIHLGDCLFDTDSYNLWRNNTLVTPELTSTEAKLLIYLYENRDRIISREELLSHVASSRVVSDSIVTQYIKTLRKALGDTPKNSTYIRTYQKQGYQFIATVSQKKQKSNKPLILTTIVLLVVISIVVLINSLQLSPRSQQFPTPITSLYGYELYGTTTPDRNYILFSHQKHKPGSFWQLVLKSIDQEKYFQLTDADMDHLNADISRRGDRVAYHVYNDTINEIRVSDINWQTYQLENTRSITTLTLGLNTVFLTWKDDNHIYYSSREDELSPVSIKLHNIEQETDIIVTVPEGNGAGDLALAYSPERGQLAFTRNIGYSKSEIYTYDEDSNSLTLHASLPTEPFSIDWTDSGQIIVKDKESSISLINLRNGQLTPIVIDRDSVYAPFNIDSNSIGYTSGNFVAYDIQTRRLDQRDKPTAFVNSSFNDFRPSIADDTNTTAFISNRTGINQIWVKEASGELRQVTNFDDSVLIEHLAISPDGSKIAYTENAEIHLINSYSGETIGHISGEEKGYIDPVFNSDSSKLFYTYNLNDTWYIENRHLDDFALASVLTKGYLVRPCTSSNCYYYLRLTDKALMKRNGLQSEVDTGIRLPNVGFADQFEIIGESVYYSNLDDNRIKLYRHDIGSESAIEIMTLDAIHFDINFQTKMIFYLSKQPFDTNIEKLIISTN